MTHKKWICIFLSIVIFMLSAFGGLTYLLDPLLQFHKESPILTYYEYDEVYSNPGIAKQYDYDTILVGTSLIQNTDVQEFQELLYCDVVRLPYSGGTSCNMKTILDIGFSSHNTISYVYWELNKHQLVMPADEPVTPLPEYLYGKDSTHSLSYLLNLDIFYRFTFQNILKTMQGNIQGASREGITFSGDFSKEGALSQYSRSEKTDTPYPEDYYLQVGQENLDRNILPLVRENPDTTFVFFMVPLSTLFWDYEIMHGTFDATFRLYESILPQLLAYDNVEVHFLVDDWDIVTDLNHYKDYSHYSPEINAYITRVLADRTEILTKENVSSVLENTKQYLSEYDYDSIFS